MKITSLDIIGQLERLAEACPWDNVDIWVCREPEGRVSFMAKVDQNDKMGMPYIFESAEDPEKAVSAAIERAKDRDPEKARTAKIAELKANIEKLQSVVIGLPPYRPNRELSNGEPAIRVKETMDV